jgi:hypothetical protein
MDACRVKLYQQQPSLLKRRMVRMKVTVDVDCTPEEARRFMGLPDMSSVHEIYLDKIKRSIEEGIGPDTVEAMMRAWAPMGEAGMTMWRQMFDQMSGNAPK